MPVPFSYQQLEVPCRPVDAVWSFAAVGSADAPVDHIVLPDGCMDVIHRWHPVHDNTGSFLISGASRSAHTLSIAPGTCFVGMRINPAFGRECLKLEPAGYVDRVTSVEGGARAIEVLCDVLNQTRRGGSLAGVREEVERVAVHTRPDWRAVEAVRYIRVTGGRITPHEIARRLGTPERTLRRVVLAATGLTPKTLGRIVRFRRSLQLRTAHGGASLAALALEAGYSDQAHMTREFRALGGFSPGRFPRLLVS